MKGGVIDHIKSHNYKPYNKNNDFKLKTINEQPNNESCYSFYNSDAASPNRNES